MKELNVNQLENLEGGKFWGSDNCRWEGNACYSYEVCDYYVLWINTGSSATGRDRVNSTACMLMGLQ